MTITLLLLFILDPATLRLSETLGRNEWRIYSEPLPLSPGRSVFQLNLESRLKHRGYQRVHSKPEKPGTYFFGTRNFWIFRRAHHLFGKDRPPLLFALHLGTKGRIQGIISSEGELQSRSPRSKFYLEPVMMAESLDERRAPRSSVRFDKIPKLLWQSLLAAEDSRFFEHHGLDSKAIARSMIKNVKAGKIVMGGSTLTQQLIKNRDLTPKRSFGRKASEAFRALAIESEYEKEEILEAYINHVYMGHVNAMAVYGFPAAAKIYFSKSLDTLTLSECAQIAAMVQGPNRLQPHQHSKRLEKRRNWVLERLYKLNWISKKAMTDAQKSPVNARMNPPRRTPYQHVFNWIHQDLKQRHRHFRKGHGGFLYTTLDPVLQDHAQKSLSLGLKHIRTKLLKSRLPSLEGALISMDLETGGILAYASTSTDPKKRSFDRVRLARRQLGSTVKPFVLLAAFEPMSSDIFPGSLVLDAPFEFKTGPNIWRPKNYDNRFHGTVTLREALVQSYNVPFARLGHHIGYTKIAKMAEKLDLSPPKPVPPAISLGALEATPLQVLQAYSVFFRGGEMQRLRYAYGYDTSKGRKIKNTKPWSPRKVKSGSAYLVYDLLVDAMQKGTGRPAQLKEYTCAGKTGTSSDYRDGWFIGQAGSVLTVIWVGTDDNRSIRLPSSQTAAGIWKRFMAKAVPLRPAMSISKPSTVKTCKINPKTGLRVWGVMPGYTKELYRRGAAPPREKAWKASAPNRIE